MEREKICAVVLAGGFGTRLSPLTDSVPKPLMKVLDKTVLSLTVEKLLDVGIKNIYVSSFYKWEMICEHMKEYKDVKVIHEAYPVGTAGGAKLCCDGKSENVLVLSGDGIFDFDLEKIIEFHTCNNADVTIVSTHSKNPTRFGVVVSDENGNVDRILEKPPWRKVVTNVVNTGIYVLSKRAVEQIPDGTFFDFSKDLFPKLLKNGFKVMTATYDEYWCDIGSLDEYLTCNLDGCFGKIKSLPNTRNERETLIGVGIDARDDVFLGDGAVLGCNVVIEKGFVCSEGCSIGNGCRISSSVLGKDVKIGDGSGVYGSVIGDGVVVEDNCIIPEGCIIEQGCVIGEGTVLEKNTSVYKNGQVGDNSAMKMQKQLFSEDSTVVFRQADVVENAEKFCRSLSLAMKERKKASLSAGVIFETQNRKVKDGVLKGFITGGASVTELCDAKECHMEFADIYYPTDMTVCVSDFADGIRIKVMTGATSVMSGTLERQTEKYFYSYDANKNDGNCCDVVKIYGTEQMYMLMLSLVAKKLLGKNGVLRSKISFVGSTGTSCLEKVIKEVSLCQKENTTDLTVISREDGIKIKGDAATLDEFHILACVMNNAESMGLEKVYIDEESPDIFESILKKNKTSYSYVEQCGKEACITDMFELLVCRDRNFTALSLICISELCGKNVDVLYRNLPRFEVFTDIFACFSDRAASMERLCRLYSIGDRKGCGVTVHLADGNVTVIPDRVSGFKIMSEAINMETAKEICFRISKSISENNERKL